MMHRSIWPLFFDNRGSLKSPSTPRYELAREVMPVSNNRRELMTNHRRIVEREKNREARREADLAQLDAIEKHCDHLECLMNQSSVPCACSRDVAVEKR